MTIPTPRNSTRLGTRTRTASSDASKPAVNSDPAARISCPSSMGQQRWQGRISARVPGLC
jgi:hypothetical protein